MKVKTKKLAHKAAAVGVILTQWPSKWMGFILQKPGLVLGSLLALKKKGLFWTDRN